MRGEKRGKRKGKGRVKERGKGERKKKERKGKEKDGKWLCEFYFWEEKKPPKAMTGTLSGFTYHAQQK